MKIRSKDAHGQIVDYVEPVFITTRAGKQSTGWADIYSQDSQGRYAVYPTHQWDPMPETKWEDITQQVQISDDGQVLAILSLHNLRLILPPGYRFRKPSLIQGFVVEREVTG